MKEYKTWDDIKSFGDLFWVNMRGFLFTALCFVGLTFFFIGLDYFTTLRDKTDIENIKYCPNCGVNLIERNVRNEKI